MTSERPPLDVDDLVREYVERGASISELSRRTGRWHKTISQALIDAGVTLRLNYRWTAEDTATLVRRYVDERESTSVLARDFGVSMSAINQRLRRAGVRLRSVSEANILRMGRRSPEEKRRFYARIAATMRGREVPLERMRAAAITKQQTQTLVGQGEVVFCDWLRKRGLDPIPQLAVDRYNIDIGILPVAVEIHFGAGSPFCSPKMGRKVKDLTEGGLHVLVIWVTRRSFLLEAAADDAVAFLEVAKRDPAPVGQYRVIRGSGEFVAAGRGDFDKIARVPTARYVTGG